MLSITHPAQIPFRSKGDKFLSSSETNGLIEATRKIITGPNISEGNLVEHERQKETILITATENIVPYSIFTIKLTTEVYRFNIPTADSLQITGQETNLIYITNVADDLIAGVASYCYIMGAGKAWLLNYHAADGVPTVNGIIGPKPGTYKVSVLHRGLMVVAPPDTINNLVWCVNAAHTKAKSTIISWARTIENWRKNGSDPRVSCRTVTGSPARTSSTVDGSETPFWVYLPRCGHESDPNVVTASNIPFMMDQDGSATCIGDYLDDKILTVKQWAGTKAAIPTGWKLMDGIENAIGNGGTGFSFLVGDNNEKAYARFTNEDAQVGNSGGLSLVLIRDHQAFEVVACINDHSGSYTGIDEWFIEPFAELVQAHIHELVIEEQSGHDHNVELDIDGVSDPGSPHTHQQIMDGEHEHGITIPTPDGSHDHTGSTGYTSPGTDSQVGGGTIDTGYADVSDAGHTHEINYVVIYPTEEGAIERDVLAAFYTATDYANVSDAGHVHTMSGGTMHSHTVDSHLHEIFATSSVHTHTIEESEYGEHSHTIEMENSHTHNFGFIISTISSYEQGHHHHGSMVLSGGEHEHTIEPGIHYHNFEGLIHTPAQESLEHEPISIEPPYLLLMFIERVDNSAGE